MKTAPDAPPSKTTAKGHPAMAQVCVCDGSCRWPMWCAAVAPLQRALPCSPAGTPPRHADSGAAVDRVPQLSRLLPGLRLVTEAAHEPRLRPHHLQAVSHLSAPQAVPLRPGKAAPLSPPPRPARPRGSGPTLLWRHASTRCQVRLIQTICCWRKLMIWIDWFVMQFCLLLINE